MENNQILDTKEIKLVEKLQAKDVLNAEETKLLYAYKKCFQQQHQDCFKEKINRMNLSKLESFRTLMLQNNFHKVYLKDCLDYDDIVTKRKINFDTLLMDEIEKIKFQLFNVLINPQVTSDQLLAMKNDLYRTLAGNEILIDHHRYIHQRYFILDGPYHYLKQEVYQQYCDLLFDLFKDRFTGEIMINPADMVMLFQDINQVIMEKQKGEYSGARHLELAAQFKVLNKYFQETLKPVFFDEMQYNGNICIPKTTISQDHLLNLSLVLQQGVYYLAYLVERHHTITPCVEAFNIFNNKSLGKNKYKIVSCDVLKQCLMDMNLLKEQYTVAEIQQVLEQLNQKKTEKRVKTKK